MSFTSIANTLQGNTAVQIFVCLLLCSMMLLYYKKFVLWIIFLPYSGIWAYHLNDPWSPGYNKELMFLSSYFELMMVSYFMWCWLLIKRKDKISLWLAVMPLTAIPSLINSQGHFYLSIFLLYCMFCGAGVYRFFWDNIEYVESKRLVDITVLTLLVLGIGIKVYIGLRLGQSFINQRGGGILGSNTIAINLFLLLPLVKNRWLSLFTVCFLLVQFSKGIYIGLISYAILWMVFVNKRIGMTILILMVCFGYGMSYLGESVEINAGGKTYSLKYFIMSRLRLQGDYSIISISSDLRNAIVNSDRVKLWRTGEELAKATFLLGSGPGSTHWELSNIQFPYTYSNMHNMFLTCLIECGLIFTISLACFIIYLLINAFFINRRIFVGLIVWTFYQMYTGNIYETGGFATAGGYYFLLFVVAHLFYFSKVNNHVSNKIKKAHAKNFEPHFHSYSQK